MRKLVLSALAATILSGCSVARMAEFAASDMSHDEYNFIRVMEYTVENLDHCGAEVEPIRQLAYERIQQTTDKDYVHGFTDPVSALASLSDTDSDCKKFSDRIITWHQTGVLPANFGGEIKDPSYTPKH